MVVRTGGAEVPREPAHVAASPPSGYDAAVKRILALLVVVAAAGLLAWRIGRSGDPSGDQACAVVEKRLKALDFEGAKRAADEARPRVPPYVGLYLDALIELSTASQLEQAGRPDVAARHDAAAVKATEEAYASGPAALANWRIVSMMFFTRVRSGRVQEAWNVLDAYLQAHPGDERALAAAAQYWVEMRSDAPDPTRAIEYLDRVAALRTRTVADDDPTYVPADLLDRLRAAAEGLRGRTASAIASAEARVQAAPEDGEARAQLAEAYRQAGKHNQAVASYRDAVRLDPSSEAFLRNLVTLLLDDPGAGREVADLTAKLVKLHPDEPAVIVLRARALVRLQDTLENEARSAGQAPDPRAADGYAEAIDLYKTLIQREPPVPQAVLRDVWRNLGVALYDWKQGGRKGEYLDKAYTCLVNYLRLGGVIDGRLQDVWEKLESEYRAKHPEAPGK